jgi:hypothetical protein
VDRFVLNVAGNFVGDAVFALVLTAVAIAASTYVWRRRVRRFFGIRPGRAPIRIRLSNLYVQRTKANVPITTGFQGPAMLELEYRHALRLAREIQTKPLVRALVARIDDLSGQWIDPVVCEIGLSPSYGRAADGEATIDLSADHELVARLRRDLERGTFVLVGSSIYNLMTFYVLDVHDSPIGFTLAHDRQGNRRRAITVRHFHADGSDHTFPRELGDRGLWTDHFALQKIVGESSTIFVCASTCASGTIAAVQKLSDWRALWRRFGDRPFAALYEFTTYDPDGEPEWDSMEERWTI